MLYEVLRHIRNFFPVGHYTGRYEVKSGCVDLPFLKDGQYFLIEGSVFNDGVYIYPVNDLTDEAFTGTVTAMAVPVEVVELAAEIKAYREKNGAEDKVSESFGGYSYTRATNANGQLYGWKDAFRDSLDVWRKR